MIKDLLAYQEQDAKLRKIEVELSQSPARKKVIAAKNFIESTPESVSKLDDKAGNLSNQYAQLLEQQKSLNASKEELVKALEFAEDNTEISFLMKKADELVSAIKQLSSATSKIEEEIQKVLKDYSTLKNSTKSAQAQYAEAREEYEKLKESVKEEKEAIQKQLLVLKKAVDPSLMEKYEKKRANKIFPIVYEANVGVCGACRMELSMLEINKLKNGEIIECDQCGRMLYKS